MRTQMEMETDAKALASHRAADRVGPAVSEPATSGDHTMTLDLTRDVPRSPFASLDGFVWLPRMIDKARACFAGQHGADGAYPSPADRQFLAFFGIDAQAFGTIIKEGASDERITAYVATQTQRTAADKAAFALRQLNPPTNLIEFLALKVVRRRLRVKFQALHPHVPFGRLDSFPKMLALDEGHAILGL